MKKQVIISILFLGILAFSCKKNVTPTYTLTVPLTFPSGFTLGGVPDGTEVKLINSLTGRETILITTGGTGIVSSVLTEGSYDGSCSFTVKVGTDEYVFNGVLTKVLLSKDTSAPMTLTLAKNTGGFILKEIYFAGSKTPDAKTYYSDQFHEIYNNSNETLYADGLCIGFLEQTPSAPNVWVNADGSAMTSLPTTFQQWIIPGTGKEHPVLPGKSIVIAQDGIDHKTDPNGNPLSPVNLANADWESYVAASGKDTDSPGVPNMTLMYTTSVSMVDWLHSVFGYAEIIYRLPVPWEQFVANPANFKTKPGSTSATQYMMVPVSYVIDGVEIVYPDETKRNKRLPASIDAGYTWIDGGTYCSKSVRRKAKLIVDGRVIYRDTNNSTNDFLHDLVPTPWINPTSVEN
ncbi:MAG: DUF4876 domain-containing protein [Prolixibacteraceae bacterium]